jgi:hypothetical protein
MSCCGFFPTGHKEFGSLWSQTPHTQQFHVSKMRLKLRMPGAAILLIRTMPIKVIRSRHPCHKTFWLVRSTHTWCLHAWETMSKPCNCKMIKSCQVLNTKKPLTWKNLLMNVNSPKERTTGCICRAHTPSSWCVFAVPFPSTTRCLILLPSKICDYLFYFVSHLEILFIDTFKNHGNQVLGNEVLSSYRRG